MIILKNTDLRVSILHPIDDRAKLGPRFCTGGYVYQVEDHTHGALLSGPEYPSHAPSVLNGQGMPDVFQHTLYDDPADRPEKKLIIGVGLLDNSAGQTSAELHFSLPVEAFCQWKIAEARDGVSMLTRQDYGPYALELERTVSLTGRALVASTRIKNLGLGALTFRWFAHPFFPRMVSEESYMPEFQCVLPENPGFVRREDGSIGFSHTYDWMKSCYQLLMGVEGARFAVYRRHPAYSTIRVEGDFPMTKAALWANQATFSIEPFYQKTLDPNAAAQWKMTYHF